jgi:soluble lytic murein transglycosylase-like protein
MINVLRTGIICTITCCYLVALSAFGTQMMSGSKPHSAKSIQPAPIQEVDPELRELLVKAVNQQELKFNDQYDAQAWMMAMSSRLQPYIADERQRFELLTLIYKEATLSGLKPEVVLAVIEVESRFDRFAVSRVGAQGMMQVMPFWKNEIGRPDDNLTVTPTNLRYGCTILKYYLDKENGNLRTALADYNGSSVYGNYPDLVFNAYKRKWKGGEL